MAAELKEIFYIIEDFCMEHYILILVCTNALALLLAIICLFRTSKRRKKQQPDDFSEEVKLNFSIERAEVKIGQVSAAAEDKFSGDSELPQETVDISNTVDTVDTASSAETDDMSGGKPEAVSDEKPVVIEKLIPIESKKAESGEYYTSRSGRVYSKEDVLNQIKD